MIVCLLLLSSCCFTTILAHIEVVNQMGSIIGYLDHIQPDDTIGILIRKAASLLAHNQILIKPNSYFQIAGIIINESHHNLEIAEWNISPQSIDDKPSQIIFYQPDHSSVNQYLIPVLSELSPLSFKPT